MKDTIYREDAIKAMRDTLVAAEIPYAINALFKVQSADRPRGEWIHCSERLPEKAGHYLCSFKKANRIDSIYVDLAYWTGGRWYGYLADEINAWMPLPEPWKGANDETNH